CARREFYYYGSSYEYYFDYW
nr:immunoglobulin heavy chain junction region [Mus musculus]MBK4196888.1 immunoglobulin heavy chain junction region [Mus musculus]MBK4196895.1 immunoglobulin heavy chain junction region [Mus musculus]